MSLFAASRLLRSHLAVSRGVGNSMLTKKVSMPLMATTLQQRNAGTSVLGCAIALVAVGGCAQGMGSVLAALVVGIARNPSMKEDLFTYTMIGLGLIEFPAMVIMLTAAALYFSE
jgi:F0F1-type ATP synthase membrane subunit c/vacuolar-type H+-ATPase subunit K